MSWSVLTSHARALLCIARDPGARPRHIAAGLGSTERSAHGIVTDLTAAGYVIKHKDGRRTRCQVQARLPLPEPATGEPAIGEVLALLAGAGPRLRLTGPGQAEATAAERACRHPADGPRRQPGTASSGHRPLMDPEPGVLPGPGRSSGKPRRPYHRRAANRHRIRYLPRGQLPGIAPPPPAGSSRPGPGKLP
jgi:hypothetical protein